MLFAPKERGQGLVEYALILIFVALALIIIVTLFGSALRGAYENIVNSI